MNDDGWSRSAYVADDGRAMYLISRRGLVPPPVIEMHEPMVGAVRFVYAGPMPDPTGETE